MDACSAGHPFPFAYGDPDVRLGRADPGAGARASGGLGSHQAEAFRSMASPALSPVPPVGDRGPPLAQATLVRLCSPAPPRLPPSQQSGEKQNPTFRPVNPASFTLAHRGG